MWALADPELNGYVGSAGTVGEAWPHLQQVCRLERQRVVKGKKQVAVSYAISSLPATDADARRLLSLSRGHWGIENRLHWVRDVTFDEDRSQVRTGAAPQVLAGLRNLVISLVRRAGHSNVAAALRRHNAHLSEAFDMMGFLPTRQENEKALALYLLPLTCAQSSQAVLEMHPALAKLRPHSTHSPPHSIGQSHAHPARRPSQRRPCPLERGLRDTPDAARPADGWKTPLLRPGAAPGRSGRLRNGRQQLRHRLAAQPGRRPGAVQPHGRPHAQVASPSPASGHGP